MIWKKQYTREEFFEALYQEDAELVRTMLRRQRELCNAQDGEWHALTFACYIGNAKLTDALLTYGGKLLDVNVRDRMDYTPLLWATERDHDEVAHLLLNRDDVDVNHCNDHGETPLLLASRHNRPRVVQRLLYHNANVHHQLPSGETALSHACARNSVTIVRILLAAGANVNTVNLHGYTPLAEASLSDCRVIMQTLIEAGAEMNAVNNYGSTPLLLALKGNSSGAVNVLVRNGADLNKANEEQENPVIAAVRTQDVASLKLLVGNGATVEEEDLVKACEKGNLDSMYMIVRKSPNLCRTHMDVRPDRPT